tara:strand:- start:428 stop:964 length:537 start_codon:yes stop_codon:yes gene_type:complete
MANIKQWRNRIIGPGEESPDQLLANPRNWRIHPKEQQDAVSGVMDRVGWVQQVVVNKRTGFVLDGHMRVSIAISRNEPMVPVLYVDLDEKEEALVLATFDSLSALAKTDDDQLRDLVSDIGAEDELRNLLASIRLPVPVMDIPPDDFDVVEVPDKSSFRCPKCAYEWSGASSPQSSDS